MIMMKMVKTLLMNCNLNWTKRIKNLKRFATFFTSLPNQRPRVDSRKGVDSAIHRIVIFQEPQKGIKTMTPRNGTCKRQKVILT